MEHNIDILRKRAGLTVKDLAERSGISRDYLNKLKAGNKRLNLDVITRLAKTLRVQPAELIATQRVPIIGVVGGGEEVFPIDDLPLIPRAVAPEDEDYVNCEWVEAPPGMCPVGVVALRVTGDSMKPFMPPGTVVYYAERFEGGAPDHCLSSLCVVQLRDGRTLVKLVRKSHLHGRFDLQSYNMDTITDVELAWCAPVVFIKPFFRHT